MWHALLLAIAIQNPPAGGGAFNGGPRGSCLTHEQRLAIESEIAANVARLHAEGRLIEHRGASVSLNWPLKTIGQPGRRDLTAVSNFVDLNASFPNQLLDFTCGNRTYDTTGGYNHSGIDYFTWPFTWKNMDDGQVEIVAAAAGQIVLKADGHNDRSCTFNGNPWNAVYVRHSDGATAWYGHMKNGSLTTKAVGDLVAVGEYLGLVGSSGNSTGPHLHFELRSASNQTVEPHSGSCRGGASLWASQRAYRDSALNELHTHSAVPAFATCPSTTETPNIARIYPLSGTVRTAAYYRDQSQDQITSFRILRPNGTVWQTWNHTSPSTYNASYWFWNWNLPSNTPGVWRFEASFQGHTLIRDFGVGDLIFFDRADGG